MKMDRIAFFHGRLPEDAKELALRAEKNTSLVCANCNLLGATIYTTMGVFENIIGAAKSVVRAIFSEYKPYFTRKIFAIPAHPFQVGYRAVDGVTDHLRDAILCAIATTGYSFTILTSPLGIRNWVHLNILCTKEGLS